MKNTTLYPCIILLGFTSSICENTLESYRASTYLANNLITLAAALMAINSLVLVIGAFAIKTTIERWGKSMSHLSESIDSMALSLKETVACLAIAVIASMCYGSELAKSSIYTSYAINTVLFSVFYCCVYCLYDTARAMLTFVKFDPPAD